ncbi:MAG: septum formation protein [Parvibaculaceae bacterium]|jgi:septum formation protein
MTPSASLILASGSQVRARLLADAGVPFQVEVSAVDEARAKEHFQTPTDGMALAQHLALLKAKAVGKKFPNHFVLAADQVLTCDGRQFDKAETTAQAAENLEFLRGKTHTLHSALCIVKDHEQIWAHQDAAHLTMRPFSDEFLTDYLHTVGDTILSSVGCYLLENTGTQLFDKIDGNYFTILGLPLLPVLEFARLQGILKT